MYQCGSFGVFLRMALLPAAALGVELRLALGELESVSGGFCPCSAAAWSKIGVGEGVVFRHHHFDKLNCRILLA